MSSPKKILVIDDEAAIQKLLGLRLRSVGYDVQAAGDGREALKKIASFDPHLLILDINLPRIGGIALYDKLCGKSGRPKVPVLVLTGRADLGPLFKDLQADGFVAKPFKFDDLLREIRAILLKHYGPDEESAAVRGARSGGKPRRHVLIVEDERDVFDRLVAVFAGAGFEVTGARNAAEAVERVREGAPDAILVKAALADLPGDLLAVKLKSLAGTGQTEKTPRVVLYGAGGKGMDDSTRILCERSGLDRPVESDDAMTLLQNTERFFDGSPAS